MSQRFLHSVAIHSYKGFKATSNKYKISSLILFIKEFTEVNIASPSVFHQATIPSIISLIIWSATSKIGFKTSAIFSKISNNASNTTETVFSPADIMLSAVGIAPIIDCTVSLPIISDRRLPINSPTLPKTV